MFGANHSGGTSRSICLERSIVELSGVKRVWNKAFCSSRARNMFGTKHSGAPGR
jgi:hypothetical protein